MEKNNPLYRNQGIHVIGAIFTVDKGIVKILLIKRTNEPYKDKWALVGGALYNNEDLINGLNREIKEKTGIENTHLYLSNVHGKVNRSPIMRMVAISYVGVIDKEKNLLNKVTEKTKDAKWFPINEKLPSLAYDHKEIIDTSLKTLQKLIFEGDILLPLFPNGFTIPEIQKTYEAIMGIKYDRRNFRKKLLNTSMIEETDKKIIFNGKKPAKVYMFKKVK